jgi:hypothetical protein
MLLAKGGVTDFICDENQTKSRNISNLMSFNANCA